MVGTVVEAEVLDPKSLFDKEAERPAGISSMSQYEFMEEGVTQGASGVNGGWLQAAGEPDMFQPSDGVWRDGVGGVVRSVC